MVKIFDFFFLVMPEVRMRYSVESRGLKKKNDSRLLTKMSVLIYHSKVRVAERAVHYLRASVEQSRT